ncbi:DMT family transporter [Pikeienuella sp. HZG-20]|uniref:DMT family transporter n=1 Tax=Paludibacillus litoralis TaxID=3133267 RepID=UPI0030EEFB9B
MALRLAARRAPLARAENIAAGIGWTLITGLLFVLMTGIVRHLGSSLPPAEGAFFRYAFGLLFVSPALIGVIRRPPALKIWALYGGRGLLHGFGVILWFYAMARIPIAEVTALNYATPIFITILAAIFLGERLQARRIAAIIVGIIGVAIILRPGFHEIGAGQLAQICATPFFAASFILAKRLTRDAAPVEIVAMLSLACTLVLLPAALSDWRDPTWAEVGWLALAAAIATAGHYTLTLAYRCAPISVTQPVTFLQIVWATALGVVAFGEPVDLFILFGAAVIVSSAWYITVREMRAKGAADIPPVAAASREPS